MEQHPTSTLMGLQLEDGMAAVFSATSPTSAPLPERVTQEPGFTPCLRVGFGLEGGFVSGGKGDTVLPLSQTFNLSLKAATQSSGTWPSKPCPYVTFLLAEGARISTELEAKSS